MRDGTVKALSWLHKSLFRASGGRIGRRLPSVGAPMLLLTTTGRNSGRPHTVPLLYLPDDDGFAVIASYGGRPHHPDWYLNLLHEPAAEVQVGERTVAVIAVDARDGERERLWQRALEAYPGYAEYQARTDRVIPVVALRPAGPR